MEILNLVNIKEALSGNAAAFRSITEYQPAGGPGDKIFPPTYEGGKYATESRYVSGEEVECVLLDSVQSQANRMELVLLGEWESGEVPLPVISVDFTGADLPKPFRVTSLEAPHRIADALLRDSELDGVMFRQSSIGKRLDALDTHNATALFELCPTALVFGMWDSTGPRGGLGVKFQRALVSEIVGFHAKQGKKTSSRIDPAQISSNAGPLYLSQDDNWTLSPDEAVKERGNPTRYNRNRSGAGTAGNPSKANHGNVTPAIAPGGFTISKAVQTTVLSLPALRRLRFPIGGGGLNAEADLAARAVLTAQALFAASLVREKGADLRSRCLLHTTSPLAWELLDGPGNEAKEYRFPGNQARIVYRQAVEEAKAMGLPWLDQELVLKPSRQLQDLVRRSQNLATKVTGDSGEVES